MSKPCLLIQIRPDDTSSDQEYEAILRFGNISADTIHRVRIESGTVPPLSLDDYSAVIIGGGPWNPGDPADKKSAEQRSAEQALLPVLHDLITRDLPCFAICYGLEILTLALGTSISHDFAEKPSAIDLTITEEGSRDPLLQNLPSSFRTFVGHKEAAANIPADSVHLAYSEKCPVHMYRAKKHLYAVQFHPELDSEGMVARTEAYRGIGVYPDELIDEIQAAARQEVITVPQEILRRFFAIFVV